MDFLKTNWLAVLSYLFFAVALGVLVYPVFTCFNLPAATNAGVAGALVAMGVQLFVHNKNRSDKKEQQSRFHLNSWLSAYKKARNLLRDGNNDRAKWVHAARVLRLAEDLEKKITEESHRRVFEIHQMEYRYLFAEFLRKPSIHFYGVSPRFMEEISKLSREKMLDEAGERDWEVKMRDPDELRDPDVQPIPEEALYAVWQTAQWPYPYRDPLDGLKFSKEDRHLMFFGVGDCEGIAKYLKHLDLMRKRKRAPKSGGEN